MRSIDPVPIGIPIDRRGEIQHVDGNGLQINQHAMHARKATILIILSRMPLRAEEGEGMALSMFHQGTHPIPLHNEEIVVEHEDKTCCDLRQSSMDAQGVLHTSLIPACGPVNASKDGSI